MDDKILVHSKDIYHHGIDGQKWGKRKYQYEDGSLTPLGRVHYGVGQAREASKIKIREMKAETRNAVKLAKAQAKTAKAVANAEAKKIEAQTKAYKDRKEADNIVELERIKNDREADRNASEIAEKRLDNDYKIDRDLAEASKAQAENDSKSRNALKVVGGVLVAAGVGYLLYKAVKGNSVSSKENIEAGSNVINEFKNTPKSEIINKSNETNVQNLVSKTASKVTKTDKDLVNLTLGKVDKTKQAEKAGKQFGDAALKRLEKAKENMKLETKADAARKAKEAALNLDVKFNVGNKEYTKNAANASKQVASGFKTFINNNAGKMESFEDWLKKNGKTVFTARHSDNDGMILVHSATAGRDVCHYGVKGQRWGVITKKEDAPTGGRTKNVTGTTSGTTVDKTTSYGGNDNRARSENDEWMGNATAQTAALACYAVLTGKMTREQALGKMKRSGREETRALTNINGNWKKGLEKMGNFDGEELYRYDYNTFINKSVEKFNLIMDNVNEPGNESLKKQIMDFGKRAEAISNRKNMAAQVKADQAKKSENAPKQYEASDKKQKTGTMLSGLKTKDKGKLNSNVNNSVKLKKAKIKHSDGQDYYIVHSEYGEDVEHWGIKGQKWGVRRWQYEDGSLTPEGRIHYGRISEKGQQEGRLTGRTAKFNTREFNTLNRRMARNASKYEKTGQRKYAERALENAELLSNEKFVKNEARIMNDQSSAHFVLGIPGQILMAAANSSLLKEDQNIWNETKTKFQNMSLDELDKAFNETIGKTEKVKFNAKEMDKETKAKQNYENEPSKENPDYTNKQVKELKKQGYKFLDPDEDPEENRRGPYKYETLKEFAEKDPEGYRNSVYGKADEANNLAENKKLYKQLNNAKNIDEYVEVRDKLIANQQKSGRHYSMDFQELVQNDKRQYNTEWMDKESAKYNADPKKYLDDYRQKMEDPKYRQKYQE